MIVITAPTGNIGHQVLANVLAGDEPVRVIVRDPARLPASVRDRVEVIQGSHGDARVAARALAGADALFWLLPTDNQAASVEAAYAGFTRPAAEAIRDQGVKRVVDVSALGRAHQLRRPGRPRHRVAGHGRPDRQHRRGVPRADRALVHGQHAAAGPGDQGPGHDLRHRRRGPQAAHGATRDIAAVAARLLLDHTWTGQQEVPVLGPEDLSGDDMAAIISEVLGIPVRYQQIPGQAFRDQLTGHGISDAMAQGMLDMMIAKDNGLDNGVSRGPGNAIDTPTTFRQWCADTLKPAVQAA